VPYLPVTVGGDLTLIRQPGLLAFVGPICAYPLGFLFYLTISVDSRALDPGLPEKPSQYLVNFSARTPDERQSAASIQVRFSDGRAAESGDDTADRLTSPDILLNYSGGTSLLHSNAPILTAESCWWVSPLPPAGPVHFTVTLPGLPGGAGSAAFDASLIAAAASQSSPLWPDAKMGPP
jgi:hypothetical protein